MRVPGLSRRLALALLGAILAAAAGTTAARAQIGPFHGESVRVSRDEPVYYQADSVEYDRDTGIVTLSGHVEIWQGMHLLRADRVTYDRNTGVAAARGHVVLTDPDGQTTFADYAELSEGMKNGVMTDLRAQLAQNGQLAANGGRRTDARVNDLTRVIYSTCNACKDDPDKRLWDIRARSAVQDIDNKRIEYKDAVLDVLGVPVMWLPYFTHPDPTAKRQSGFLVPAIGVSKHLGWFAAVPYFIVVNDSTDMTLTPLLATKNGPELNGQFRHAFNSGTVTVDASIADGRGEDFGNSGSTVQGSIFAKGQFVIDHEWRWGFDIERASSSNYMRDFKIQASNDEILTSQIYLEGFGQGSYSRLDARAYQGLTSNVITNELPYVLPRYEYSFFGQPDFLGGRFRLDAGAFNVVRDVGTNTKRAGLSADWERPVDGMLGDLWKLVLHVDAAGYSATQLDQQPSWGAANGTNSAQAMPTAALEFRWPFLRAAADGSNLLVEPRAQFIGAPIGSAYAPITGSNGQTLLNTLIPNEDSLDFEFTDANLFALNRFPGIDRLEGGPRANVALYSAWTSPGGQRLEGQIGQGYRTHPDSAFPVGSGLNGTRTDVVGHVSYVPNQYFDFTTRARFTANTWTPGFIDALATTGPSWLKVSAGYIYERYDPYNYYNQTPTGVLTGPPADEVTVGFATGYGRWHLAANARRDLTNGSMVSSGGTLSWENECVILSANAYRRFTSLGGDNGASLLLFQITLKTVGTFGFNGL
jgi:LPS-assembly protein